MKFLGVADLAKRWNYTKQGVHQKLKQDRSFPKPIAKINSGILVFLESDIIAYEANKTPTVVKDSILATGLMKVYHHGFDS